MPVEIIDVLGQWRQIKIRGMLKAGALKNGFRKMP